MKITLTNTIEHYVCVNHSVKRNWNNKMVITNETPIGLGNETYNTT